MPYEALADTILVIHTAYVAFVVLGELAILIGAVLRWSWVRNLWFRLIHLIAIAIVAVEAVFNVNCPLTEWEWILREKAGQEFSGDSFVARLMNQIMCNYSWDPWVYNALHIGFGVLVLATFFLVMPRWRKPRLAV
jgi:hypothetical protein